jgi:hypothetical protein
VALTWATEPGGGRGGGKNHQQQDPAVASNEAIRVALGHIARVAVEARTRIELLYTPLQFSTFSKSEIKTAIYNCTEKTAQRLLVQLVVKIGRNNGGRDRNRTGIQGFAV